MSQNLFAYVAKALGGGASPLTTDTEGNLLTSSGGGKSALNVSVATVIKAAPGRLAKILIVAPGSTSGAFTFNDCLTIGAAAASNEVYTLPYNATQNVAGDFITIDWPFQTGIVLSAVPGGSPVISISYV